MKGELLAPPAAEADPKAIEVVRVWAAQGGQHVSINPFVWKNPQAWGIMLADLARHLANAYQQELGLEPKDTLSKITELLMAELTNPTDTARGQVHNSRKPHRQPK